MLKLADDRRRRAVEGVGERVDPLDLALRSSQSRAFLPQALKSFPAMKCDLSWETVEKTLEFKPIDVIDRIAPRALLLIGGEHDNVCPIEGYQKLYERAGEPKKLVVLPITLRYLCGQMVRRVGATRSGLVRSVPEIICAGERRRRTTRQPLTVC